MILIKESYRKKELQRRDSYLFFLKKKKKWGGTYVIGLWKILINKFQTLSFSIHCWPGIISDFNSLRLHYLEKEMATHSSILAGESPWTEVPGKLQSMVLQRVAHDWVTTQSRYSIYYGNILYCPKKLMCGLYHLICLQNNNWFNTF